MYMKTILSNLFLILTKKETYLVLLISFALGAYLIPRKETKIEFKEVIKIQTVEVIKWKFKESVAKTADKDKRKFTSTTTKPDGTIIKKEYEKEISKKIEAKTTDESKDLTKIEESQKTTELKKEEKTGSSSFFLPFVLGIILSIVFPIPIIF